MLVGGALLAAIMTVSGQIIPCAAVGAVAAGVKFAKQKGLVKANPSLHRLGRMIARDIQPFTNRLMQTYLRGSAPAINVLSLQRRIKKISAK